MWIDSFHQFLNRSFQRFAAWLRGVELLTARLARWAPVGLRASLPDLEGLGPCEAQLIFDTQRDGWYADLSYRYRSLHCQVRLSTLEPTPGMQRIYRALQGPNGV